MIKSYLFGGIGNQLFQYVSALYLADLSKKKINFDYSLIYGFRSYHKSKIYDLFNFKRGSLYK